MGGLLSKEDAAEEADEGWHVRDGAASAARARCDPASGALRWCVRLSEWRPDGSEAADSREFEFLRKLIEAGPERDRARRGA